VVEDDYEESLFATWLVGSVIVTTHHHVQVLLLACCVLPTTIPTPVTF